MQDKQEAAPALKEVELTASEIVATAAEVKLTPGTPNVSRR